jgi:hypothetical protein
VLGRVLDDLWPHLLADEPHQPLVQAHPDAADPLGPEPDGRRQHEVRAVGLQQIDRAHVGREASLDQPHDVRQGLGRIALETGG